MKDYYWFKYGPLPDGRSMPGSVCRWVTGFLAGFTALPLVFQIGRPPDLALPVAAASFLSFGLVPFFACLISDYSRMTAAWLIALFYTPLAILALVSAAFFLDAELIAVMLFGAACFFGVAAFTAIWYLSLHRDRKSTA